jgi:hypothetical protein
VRSGHPQSIAHLSIQDSPARPGGLRRRDIDLSAVH